jgi:hypothetical protein
MAEEIRISDGKFHSEGLDVASDGRIFVGSLVESAVYVVSPDSKNVSPFTEPGVLGMDSAVGLKVDERSRRLYVCSSPALGVSKFAKTAKPAGVLVFGLDDGKPLHRYDFPGGGFCNDIAFGRDGTLYATDSFSPRILMLRPGADQMEVFVENPELSGQWALNGLAVHHNLLYTVKQTDGRMFAIGIEKDGSSGTFKEVKLPRPLQAPDGLLMLDDGRALVVEGGRPGVVTFDPEDAEATWKDQEVEGLKVPATAALLPHGRVVVANTQNDHLTEPPGTTDPFTLTVFKLK